MERTVYLHDYCPCGGRKNMHRRFGTVPQDDNGGQFYTTELTERCDTCNHIFSNTRVLWPLPKVDEILDSWEKGSVTRAELDQQLHQLFSERGAQWKEGT